MGKKENSREASIQPQLSEREHHVHLWVKRFAQRIVYEYFDIEPIKTTSQEPIVNRAQDGFPESMDDVEPAQDKEIWRFINRVYEQAIPKFAFSSSRIGSYFSTMASFNLSHAIMLPFIMTRCGGFYFLIPFFLCTLLIVIPLNFVQYFLGQYCSMPPAVLYPRMSPVSIGIGVMVLAVQYIVSTIVKFDHRMVALAIEFLYSQVTERPKFLGSSKVNGGLNGYKPICPTSEVYHEGACYPPHFTLDTTQLGHYQQFLRSSLQSDPIFTSWASAERPAYLAMDPEHQHSHYLSSSVLFCGALFWISLSGLKKFTTFIQYPVLIIFMSLLGFQLFYLVGYFGDQAMILMNVIGADAKKLLEGKTWAQAAIHSLMIFSSSDGSFLAIGCLNKFSNDMFRDYIRSVFCSVGLLLITSLVFGMATVVGIGSFNLRVKRRDLSVLELRSLVFNDMDVYEYLYEFFNQSMLCQVCLCLFAMVFFFWQISSMMLMAEGSLGTFYRMVKSSSRLPMYTIRFIILLFHCILVLWLHIELQPHRHLPFLLTPYVVFIQSAAFNFIGFRRLFTIMLTMCSTHRLAFYKKRMQLAVYYQIFLPFFTALPVLFEMITNGFSTAKYALGIPILFGFIVLFRYRLQKQTLLALAPTRRFRPTFNRDYDEFFKQQRAIGGVVQDKSLGFRGLFKIWWMKYGKGVKEEEMGDI